MIEGMNKPQVSLQTDDDPTIMLIHGLWMTPLCWEKFKDRFEDLGYKVVVPGWPGHEGDVQEIREMAESTLAGLGLEEVVEHYKTIIQNLDEELILIGHSFGGLVVQILLDQGFGSAAITLDSAAPKGVHKLSLAQLKATFPALSNPGNRNKVVSLTFENFKYAFANTLTEKEALEAYYRYYIPDTAKPLFQSAFADLILHAPTAINYKNDMRGPLLLLAGSEDHTVPEEIVRANYDKYRDSGAITDFHEFPGRSHLIMVEEGWQEVVDYIHGWILQIPERKR